MNRDYIKMVELIIEKYKHDLIRVDGKLDMSLMKKIVNNLESEVVRNSFPKTAVLRWALSELGFSGDFRVRPYRHQVIKFGFIKSNTPHVALARTEHVNPEKAIESLISSVNTENQ